MGTLIGRVKAEDSDVGENTDMTYQIKEQEGDQGPFRVTTDSNTQEALISVQKVRRQLVSRRREGEGEGERGRQDPSSPRPPFLCPRAGKGRASEPAWPQSAVLGPPLPLLWL